MEEQSHKDEMRAAVRGDFERMRRRQVRGGEAVGPASPPAAVSREQPHVVLQGVPAESWVDRLFGRA